MTDLQIVVDPTTDVEALILDWAGTVVDFGSFAPTSIFVEAFARADLVRAIAILDRALGEIALSPK